MKVRVGTRNPLKVRAVEAAFAEAFPDEEIDVAAASVESGVSAQPFGADVAVGAIRRAKAAIGDADFGVGIEAGLVHLPGCDRSLNLGLCAVVDRTGRVTLGSGPGFEVPPAVLARLEEGSTLNREMSRIAGIPEIKEKIGAIGHLSGGRIDRFAITRETVLMALIPRLKADR
jgi:inosine/xanthosine triphosphatase